MTTRYRCCYCWRPLTDHNSHPQRAQNRPQQMCTLCAKDYAFLFRLAERGVSGTCEKIDRAEAKLEMMKLFVRNPDSSPSKLLDEIKKPQRIHVGSSIEETE